MDSKKNKKKLRKNKKNDEILSNVVKLGSAKIDLSESKSSSKKSKKSIKEEEKRAESNEDVAESLQEMQYNKKLEAAVDDIFHRIGSDIDLSYAQVGCLYGGKWRPVLSHSILVDLLINYGYRYEVVLAFIEQMSLMFADTAEGPIILADLFRNRIYEDILHIPEVDKMMELLDED